MSIVVPVVLGHYRSTINAHLGVLVDNGKSYDFKDAAGTTTNGLELDSADDLNIGDATSVDEINIFGSAGVLNIVGPSGANNIVEIQAATGRSSNFRMAGIDIGHAMTDFAPSDVYGQLEPLSTTLGGVRLSGLSDGDGSGFRLYGLIGSTNPTDTIPAIQLIAGKSDGGTNAAVLADTETAFVVQDPTGGKYLTITGDGHVGIGDTTPTEGLIVGSISSATLPALHLTQGSTDVNLRMQKTTLDGGFFDFLATADADTTSAISTHNTSGATTDHIQIELNGVKAWIAVSTNPPTA